LTGSGAGSTSNVTFGAGPASPVHTKQGKVVKVNGKVKYAIDGRPYFSYDSSPGGVTHDWIEIVNYAHKAQRLAVYPVDAMTASDGAFAYSPRSAKRRLAGAWISVGTRNASGMVTLPARSQVVLPVRLRVPRNAPPGDHAAAIVVSLTGLVTAKGKRVNFEQRVATRALVRVSGKLRPALSIEDLHIHYSGVSNPFGKGSASVSYTVVNNGNAMLGGTQEVVIHGLLGASATLTAIPGVPLLLPGAKYPVHVKVPGVFPEAIESAKVEIVPQGLRGAINPGLHPESASAHFWAVPWLLILIVVVLIAATAVSISRRRRTRKPGAHRKDATPQRVSV
jgi:hypothetical protein